MTDVWTDVSATFLTTGPSWRLRVPDPFDPEPEVVSVIRLPSGAGRECVYTPGWLDDAPLSGRSEYTRLPDVQGIEGSVRVYERDDGEQWFLEWPLARGVVTMHLRALEDQRQSIQVVADNLRVLDADGTPTALPEGPLGRRVEKAPGYEEIITFFGRDESGTRVPGVALRLRRPSLMARGEFRHIAAAGPGVYRRGAAYGVEVEVVGFDRDEAEAITGEVAMSVARSTD